MDEFAEAIKTCPDFGAMYAYLNQATLPSNDDAARTIILESNDFTLEHGILFHFHTPRTKNLNWTYTSVKQVCVPWKFQSHVALSLHDYTGLPGIDRLFSAYKLRYYFHKCTKLFLYMFKVVQFVKKLNRKYVLLKYQSYQRKHVNLVHAGSSISTHRIRKHLINHVTF